MKKLIALSLICVLALCLLSGCGKTAVDLTDYVNVRFSGANGNGRARCDLDYSALEAALAADSSKEAGLGSLLRLESSIHITVTPDKNLSNGDKVTVTVSFDADAAKTAGYKLKGGSRSFTVKGLSEK